MSNQNRVGLSYHEDTIPTAPTFVHLIYHYTASYV